MPASLLPGENPDDFEGVTFPVDDIPYEEGYIVILALGDFARHIWQGPDEGGRVWARFLRLCRRFDLAVILRACTVCRSDVSVGIEVACARCMSTRMVPVVTTRRVALAEQAATEAGVR